MFQPEVRDVLLNYSYVLPRVQDSDLWLSLLWNKDIYVADWQTVEVLIFQNWLKLISIAGY